MICAEFVDIDSDPSKSLHRVGRRASTLMEKFYVGQKWIMSDPIFGTYFGEVIEIADDSASGTVIVTDDQGNIVDTFSGSASEFQASGEWQLIVEGAQ